MHPRATIVAKNQNRAVWASKTKLFSGKPLPFSQAPARRSCDVLDFRPLSIPLQNPILSIIDKLQEALP